MLDEATGLSSAAVPIFLSETCGLETRHRAAVDSLLLLSLGAAAFLIDLGQETHLGSREARHAEIAREMVESGNYVVPNLLGKPYIDKPPLFNWVVALLFRVTGRVDFAVARFPSALCAIAVMVGIYLLGRRWLTSRAALFAGTIWATSLLAQEWGRISRMDMMMACLNLYAILLADSAAAAQAGWRPIANWCGAGVLVGAAVLSKGFYALFFFGVGVMALWRARRGRWFPPIRLLVLAAGIVAGVFAVWAVSAELTHPGHLRSLVGYQLGDAMGEHPKRFTLYFEEVLAKTAPWGIFAVGATYWAIARFRRVGFDCAAVPPLVFGVSILVLTVISNKRVHYLLPAVPLWALFLGGFVDRAVTVRGRGAAQTGQSPERIPRWGFDWPLGLCLVLLPLLLAAVSYFWITRAHGATVLGVATCVVGAALAAYGAVSAFRLRMGRATEMLFLACAVLGAPAYPLVVRGFGAPLEEILGARQIVAHIPSGAPVAGYRVGDEYLYFKLNRPALFARTPEDLVLFLDEFRESEPRYLIVRTEDVDQILLLAPRPLLKVGTWKVDGCTATVLTDQMTQCVPPSPWDW